MILDIENRSTSALRPFILEEMERAAKLTLKAEGFSYETEISLSLVSSAEIRVLNNKFRSIDAPTDVLSFPAYPFVNGDYSALDPCIDIEPILLGDIVISTETAFAQAEEFAHSPVREFCFLTVHSILHLLGYDHMNDQDAQQMFKKQDDILRQAGILR